MASRSAEGRNSSSTGRSPGDDTTEDTSDGNGNINGHGNGTGPEGTIGRGNKSGRAGFPTAESRTSAKVMSRAALLPWLVAAYAVLIGVLVISGVVDSGSGLLTSVSVSLIFVVTVASRRQSARLDEMLAQVGRREAVVARLRAERDHAADSSASKTRFFAAASHDLRQPLHALSINATTLQLVAGRQADPVIRDLSVSISRALTRSNGLLDSLLDLSRLDSNSVRLKLETVNVRALLEAVCEQFRPGADERGLVLRIVDSEALRADLSITTDVVLMFRVLANLLSNAIKFTSSGSVELGVLSDHRHTTLRVTDTGRGIDAHELPHIFDEFYQVGSPPRDAETGLGLGLSIVRRAVDLLGIEIDVRSVVGSGTVVSLIVPVDQGSSSSRVATDVRTGARTDATTDVTSDRNTDDITDDITDKTADADDAYAWSTDEFVRRGASNLINAQNTLDVVDMSASGLNMASPDPIRTLLVEDEKDIRDSLDGFLPHVGFEIRSAASSNEALALIAAGFIPTVLVIDQLLRGDTGLLVVHRLWKVLGRVPAVMVTGDTDRSTSELALASGMRVVHKPVDGMRMARIIRDVQHNLKDQTLKS